jgi:hypothetical protein
VRLLARRNPAAVFGTALLAGVLVGRFLRSSRPVEHDVVFEPDPSLLEPGSSVGTTSSGLGAGNLGSGLGGPATPGSSFGGSTASGLGSSTSPSGLGNGLSSDRGSRGSFGGDPPSGGWA